MELTSLTMAFLEIKKVFEKYVYFKEDSSYLTLALYVLLTHCFKSFDSLPYILITGPYGSGKTLILQILRLLCHRALPATSISRAGFYHVIDKLKGTLLIDEVEDFAKKVTREFDMAVILNGYKRAGFVVRVDPRKRRPIKFRCFGPKVIANTGGIVSKPLLSRCIVIKTVHSDEKLQRFLVSRDGGVLKDLASGLVSLFKRPKIQNRIKSIYYNFEPVEGLTGRDEELWVGLLVIARIIDSESPHLNISEDLTKIALAHVEKRQEEAFFLDWTTKVLLAVGKYLSTKSYSSDSFIEADKLTQHVIDEANLSFKLRTETISRILDKESLLIERRVIWFRDDKGNKEHKTGWKINVERLDRRISKYTKFVQTVKEFEEEEREKIIEDLEKDTWGNLTERERRNELAKIGKPTNWKN